MATSKRSWDAFHEKLDREGNRCRVCRQKPVDPAHIIPRSRVGPKYGESSLNCCPLCRMHHRAYDEGTLDLLPHLSFPEQAYAVALVGLEEARRRLTNER